MLNERIDTAIQIFWFLVLIIGIPLVLLLLIETNSLHILKWAFLGFLAIGVSGFIVLQSQYNIMNCNGGNKNE